MRHAGRTIVAALIAGAATAAVALFSAFRLSDAPIRGRLGGPDPIGSLASLVAIAVALVAFFALGRSIGSDTTRARPAIVSGLLGGALAGLIASVAQSFALSDYLRAVPAGHAVPPGFLPISLRASLGVSTICAFR